MSDDIRRMTVYFRDGQQLHYLIQASELARLVDDFVGHNYNSGAYDVINPEGGPNEPRKLVVAFDQVRNIG